jgi:hypothetical protein
MVVRMAWVDQKDVARQHLALADEALARATADAAVSRDVIATLTELRASTVALAKIAGVGVYEGEQPTTR